ncbi:hypothetical protein [Thermosyntropha sp.]|uniref:hypothetical protein n=1 Tax=Thermosyntropha sp. TaxID=2740820 RepID=UPI0025EBF807|nr:hypothetical protein [Thermosyntropha sp.]MBO8159907.1 hypothetical protein [Thermosyntropha sp.]
MRMKVNCVLLLMMVFLLGTCSIANAVGFPEYNNSDLSNVNEFSSLDFFDEEKIKDKLQDIVLYPNETPQTIVFNDGSSITFTFYRSVEKVNSGSLNIHSDNGIIPQPLSVLRYSDSISAEYRSEQGSGPVVLVYTIHVTWDGHETLNRATLISHHDSLEKKIPIIARAKGTREVKTNGEYILVRGGWQASIPGLGGYVSHTYEFRGNPDGSAYMNMIS